MYYNTNIINMTNLLDKLKELLSCANNGIFQVQSDLLHIIRKGRIKAKDRNCSQSNQSSTCHALHYIILSYTFTKVLLRESG